MSASMSNDKRIDRLLFNEYFLIPLGERPLVGSNDWFQWLEEFQKRHPVEVSRLTQSLSERARQVLWPPDKQGLGSLGHDSGPFERPTTEDLKKKLEELGRREKRLSTEQRELESVKREMKKRLLAGATIEPEALYAELRLLPGRDPSSKDPDDYDLILSHVS
jgi:hypothetical protein